MGLARPALRFIARELKREPCRGPLLTLGRQMVFASLETTLKMLASEGITPAVTLTESEARTRIPEWIGTPNESYISDVAFFRLLGVETIQALDYSAYEHADIVADLNLPIPDSLKNRYDVIIDGGTMEHVFDVRQDLMNIAGMLRVGGRVLHLSPASNTVNHGFYQFSPTLFFDYYGINAFSGLRCYLVETPRYGAGFSSWDVFEVPAGAQPRMCASDKVLSVFFMAEKTAMSTVDKIPNQSFYQNIYATPGRGTGWTPYGGVPLLERWLPPSLRTVLQRILPPPVRGFLQRTLQNHVPGFGPSNKPWGLRRTDRLA